MSNQFHAKTLKGFESILASELEEIGAESIKIVNRGVDFSGSLAILYKANLYLRTALRILWKISAFKIRSEDDLYQRIRAIDWAEFMSYKNSLAIDAVVFSRQFRNSHFIEQKVKDAIVDQFREKTSLRPPVDKKNPDIRINVHINENFVILSLDSSGISLHKRGYRKQLHVASLSEVLAAGMLLKAGYKGDRPLMNPMCGSGTIAIEAAMIATNIYPGITGRSYAFQNWPVFDSVLYERLLESMPEPVEMKFPVIATDSDREAIRITTTNVRQAGFLDKITIRKEDFLKEGRGEKNAMLIINPPYGERLEMDDIHSFYSEMGARLKHFYPGTETWIFSANKEALKFLGLKSAFKMPLFNAGLECSYQKYLLFEGDLKTYKSQSSD